MNIFYLHEDPIQNAKWHVDKHVVKMVTEYAQLLSTAHRVLDGEMYLGRQQMVVTLKDGDCQIKEKTYYLKQVM